MKKLIKSFLAIFVALTVMVGCSSTTVEENRNVLVMGTSADYKPFQFIDVENNQEIIGFDIDLARHVAAELGYDLEVVDMDFNSLITSLRMGRVDMVLAAMTPTAERSEVVDFSDIYYTAQNVLITMQGTEINDKEDLNGLILGAQMGSIQEDAVVALQESGIDVELSTMDRMPDLFQQLLAGRIDAVVIEDMITPMYLNSNANFQLVDVFDNDDQGFAIALGKDSELTAQVNEVLATMKEDGTLEALAEKWFYEGEATGSHSLDFSAVTSSLPFIVEGVGVTLQIVFFAVLIGLGLGIVIALFKISRIKPLMGIASVYTSIFRGTPVVLQLVLIYFGLPQLFGIDTGETLAAILALGLNSAAYISEIIRAGIVAVDKGQTEASMALGIPYGNMMKKVILPQAFKNVLPAIINEFTALTKESAVVTVIGTMDIMRRSMMVSAQNFRYFETLLVAGAIYYVLVTGISLIGKVVEGRMAISD